MKSIEKAFTLTPQGIMLNETGVREKGPLHVFDVITQLFTDTKVRIHTLKYLKGRVYHVVVQEPHSETWVVCGMKRDSERTLWPDEIVPKMINCKRCKSWLKKQGANVR